MRCLPRPSSSPKCLWVSSRAALQPLAAMCEMAVTGSSMNLSAALLACL